MKTEIKVKVSLTANEWELYSSMTGIGAVARKLSSAATKGINEAHKVYAATKDKQAAVKAAWGIWSPVSYEFSKFGASDTEPRYHFDSLLIKLFCKPLGLEYNSY